MSLTSEEYAALDRIIPLVLPHGSTTTFRELVDAFRSFVGQVDGYAYSIYDYDNDISSREILDRVLERCPPALRSAALSELEDLDRRFMDLTVQFERPSRTAYGWGPIDWYARLPRHPGGEIADDIESGNL